MAFSSKRPYATKYFLLKTGIVHKTFQVFMLKCVNWISKTCFVKVKINLDIILSEITFDNGVVKRWVPYFLEVIQVNNSKNKKITKYM